MEIIREISRAAHAREHLAFQDHIRPPFEGEYEGPFFRLISFFFRLFA